MVPAAIRHKNPGAMWPGPIATKWGSTRWVYLNDGTGQGGGGKGNKIATFDNWVDGISAQLDLWRSSPKYRNKRFADAIAIWSGGNNVPAYIAYVKKRIPQMDENTIMNDAFWRGPLGIKFLQVQAGHEAGQPIPAPAEDWIAAQKRVMGGAAPATKTTTTAVVVNGTTATTAKAAAEAGASVTQIVIIVAIGLVVTAAAVWWFYYRKRPTRAALAEEQLRGITPPPLEGGHL